MKAGVSTIMNNEILKKRLYHTNEMDIDVMSKRKLTTKDLINHFINKRASKDYGKLKKFK